MFHAVNGPVSITPKHKEITARTGTWHKFSGFGMRGSVRKPPSEAKKVAAPDIPRSPALIDLARKVFDEANSSQTKIPVGAESRTGRWNLAAVPIRASNAACVNCHNGPMFSGKKKTVRLGDPLGIAIYAYTHIAKTQTIETKSEAKKE